MESDNVQESISRLINKARSDIYELYKIVQFIDSKYELIKINATLKHLHYIELIKKLKVDKTYLINNLTTDNSMEANMKDKIYTAWAFTANEFEKRNINYKIYEQLCEKYKVKRICRRSISDEQFQEILNNNDFVYETTSRYAHKSVTIYKSPDLTTDEQALICDEGNLCFGYDIRNKHIVIYTD